MSKQIIPYGNPKKYLIYSSVSDDIVCYNANEDEIIEYFVEEAAERARIQAKDILVKLNNNIKPYFQFTKTLDEVFKMIEIVHGKRVLDKRKIELGLQDEKE